MTFNPVNCDFLSVELLSTDAIAIYPNPTDGRLYLSNNNSFEQLKVYSLDGKLVVQKNLQPGMNEIHFTLNSDIYVLELNGSNPRTIKKLVIN